jgi:hypothetical protein
VFLDRCMHELSFYLRMVRFAATACFEMSRRLLLLLLQQLDNFRERNQFVVKRRRARVCLFIRLLCVCVCEVGERGAGRKEVVKEEEKKANLKHNTSILLLLFHLQCSSCGRLEHFTNTLL